MTIRREKVDDTAVRSGERRDLAVNRRRVEPWFNLGQALADPRFEPPLGLARVNPILLILTIGVTQLPQDLDCLPNFIPVVIRGRSFMVQTEVELPAGEYAKFQPIDPKAHCAGAAFNSFDAVEGQCLFHQG